ncbi:hypothetical protein Q31b_31020 [Novipirellula aureliae]|uniref:Methane oxygenase PmoA n=1 Tax=Novipirellula aureliae TaxID=2527966 RepID=A0A5C6DYE5_9BACT|nr:PmoA family protein [Novipirellula aureliae]TWU41648.1 hypothetical protein Q31b_31020 [Novipirellula aureliae]
MSTIQKSFLLSRFSLTILTIATAVHGVQPKLGIASGPMSVSSVGLDESSSNEQGPEQGPKQATCRWEVFINDDLFAVYLADSGGKPIIYPIIGPDEQSMTRHFPMQDDMDGESDDHDHQRSFWFTHGEVNGVDFWMDDNHCGHIVQTSGTASIQDDGDTAVIKTGNDWVDPSGKRLLSDEREFRFFTNNGKRIIECNLVLMATDGDVHFGDTKEGSFGIRVPSTMKVDAGLGGKITNAEGLHDAEAWGKRSNWVDYNGPVDGKLSGITIHYHPSSFAAPCYWHVRNYGLFAANPFGRYHFTGGKKTEGFTVKSGDSIMIRCQTVFYTGAFDREQTISEFEAYSRSN